MATIEVTDAEYWETLDEVASKLEDIEIAKRKLLERCGWKYTCGTPGNLWLYEKTLPDGRVALVTESAALRMQESFLPPSYDQGDD